MNKLKLTVVLVGLLLCSLMMRPTVGVAGQESRRQFELVGISMPFADRAGSDDGAEFAIHFMGDTHGSLDTCG
ncbi:MAG TPA: hypothetical protein VKM94_14500 [Blastocatellia bacterium]|nr:hypothetical protein [Blastocatellia bacterium]